MQHAHNQYQINVKVTQTKRGLRIIKGFLAVDEDEEYDASIPRHLISTVNFICWNQMLLNMLGNADGDEKLAIKNAKLDFKLRNNSRLLYMRKYAPDQEVSDFVDQVDKFIKNSILMIIR